MCVIFVGKEFARFLRICKCGIECGCEFFFFFSQVKFYLCDGILHFFFIVLFCIVFYLSNLNIIYFGSWYPHNLQVFLKRWWKHSKANGALEPFIIRNRFFFRHTTHQTHQVRAFTLVTGVAVRILYLKIWRMERKPSFGPKEEHITYEMMTFMAFFVSYDLS